MSHIKLCRGGVLSFCDMKENLKENGDSFEFYHHPFIEDMDPALATSI